MSGVAAHKRKLDAPNLDAVADEILGREDRFRRLAYDSGPTPLEGLRKALRKRRRRRAVRALVLGWPESRPAADGFGSTEPAGGYHLSAVRRPLPVWRLAAVAIVVGVATHFAAPFVTDAAVRTSLALLPNKTIASIDRARACVQARAVLDASGALIGVLPLNACASEYKFLSASVSAAAAAQMHLAWWATEGQYRVAPSTISGINLRGWTRATLQRFTAEKEEQTGGSNPIETGIKNLNGTPHRLGFSEKLHSGWNTLTFTAQRLDSDSARDRFVTEAIPCVRGAAGSAWGHQLAGDLCARFLFGKSADALDWPARCIWAASALPLYRAVGAGSPPEAIETAGKIKDWIRDRARRCVARIAGGLGWDDRKRDGYLARVSSIEFATGLAPNANGETANLQAAVPGLPYALRDELRLTRGRPAEAIRLSVAAAQQQLAFDNVMKAMGNAKRRLGPGLCFSQCNEDQVPVDFAVMLAEIKGVQLVVTSAIASSHFLLSGPIAERGGEPVRLPTHRPVGSTNKAMLVPLLIAGGYLRLCDRVPVGLSDPRDPIEASGQSCIDGRGTVELHEATARSLNHAFADAARKLGTRATRALFSHLGYDFDASLGGGQWIDGLVLGYRVTAAPVTIMRNWAALYRGVRGAEPVSHLPKIIEGTDPSGRLDWRELGLSSELLRRAGDVLAAPILDQSGTLHALAPVLRRHGCSNPIGKTGTSDSAVAQEVRDKIVIAAFQCGERRKVAYALIGSPRMDTPLGKIRAADVVQLIDAALTAAKR